MNWHCTQAEHVKDLEQAQKAQFAEAAALRAEVFRISKQLQVRALLESAHFRSPEGKPAQSPYQVSDGVYIRGMSQSSCLLYVRSLQSRCAPRYTLTVPSCRAWSAKRTPCTRSFRPARSTAQMLLQKSAAARQLPQSTPKQ